MIYLRSNENKIQKHQRQNALSKKRNKHTHTHTLMNTSETKSQVQSADGNRWDNARKYTYECMSVYRTKRFCIRRMGCVSAYRSEKTITAAGQSYNARVMQRVRGIVSAAPIYEYILILCLYYFITFYTLYYRSPLSLYFTR